VNHLSDLHLRLVLGYLVARIVCGPDFEKRAFTLTDRRIPCAIMRGGTSKAVVLAAADLPDDPRRSENVILRAFGSPDPRQIDGLGGADPLTSKLAVVSPSRRDDADVDYLFAQVGIMSPTINCRVSCGNTAAAVAVYAIQEGLVAPHEGKTTVRIFSRNSNRLIVAEVPVEDGSVKSNGNFSICGVPGVGSEIQLNFVDPGGCVTGRLIPSGSPVDEIVLPDGKSYRFSLIDCGNLYAIMPASNFLLSGTELPEQIEARPGLKDRVEDLREAIFERFFAGMDPGTSLPARAARLKIAIVANATDCAVTGGQIGDGASLDVVARIINRERVHKAFAVTGAICFAAAATIPGTVVNELCHSRDYAKEPFRIGHPLGQISATIDSESSAEGVVVKSVQVGRTARRIMDGFVYIPEDETS